MKSKNDYLKLYAVTDRSWTGRQTLLEQIEDSLKGGATCIQLREKDMEYDSFLKEALEVKKLCEKCNVPFIINDNVELALACHADGIHVGQSDMESKKVRELIGKDMILGVSAQTVAQAVEAENNGADYLGVGSIFNTTSKADADDVSIETLKAICEAVNIPVVAIGGITKDNLVLLSGTKISGIAVISAIYAQNNIEEATRYLLSSVEKMLKS